MKLRPIDHFIRPGTNLRRVRDCLFFCEGSADTVAAERAALRRVARRLAKQGARIPRASKGIHDDRDID
jgi:hypothetical protein